MKKSFTYCLLGAALLSLAGTAPAWAQIPVGIYATTPDQQPDNGAPANATYVHTGTDAIIERNSGDILQAMTWDDAVGNVTLSWSDPNFGVHGTTPLPGSLSDPDVVMAYRGDRLFANVVCISNALGNGGQTVLFIFEWDGASDFNLVSGPLPLGSPNRRHTSPNIDANELGMTAIVWQQSQDSQTTVTVSSADFPTYSFTQTVTFGRSYLAGSWINTGIIGKCYYSPEPQLGTQTGVPVIDPPTGLFEQTLRPDVAISETEDAERNPPIVSTTFIRHFVDGRGNFSIVDSLDVIQTQYNVCKERGEGRVPELVRVDAKEWSLNPSLSWRGSPRIAAIPNLDNTRWEDVEVVLDMHSYGCFENMYEVRNYGKDNGQFRQGSTLVSLPDQNFYVGGCQSYTNLRKRVAKEPVVSYFAEEMGKEGHYVVSWTGLNYHKITSGGLGGDGEEDVWANTLIGGKPITPFGGTSIAQAYNSVNRQFVGNQHTPSIAGRHLAKTYLTHLFVDDKASQLSFKLTKEVPGNVGFTPLRPAATSQPLQAYPNPSAEAVTVELQLHKGEAARQLQVVDPLGRTIDELPVNKGAEKQTVTWKPRPQLPSGIYTLKLVTSERTVNQKISRN
ncbi:T9SS type A sorting domain-containing protein [Hymenobacter sp. ASUV-10]|uniref:T9SS type A sorting domain-containing protein n=1 Tax=Hymenobacter aranciens TaxID=3063996 RepID=A0ABT9BF38_9BACT|nr:T9SS type A sorting domain-containing protein [Hymenobacter sp. ASUV-10]MDO7876889.1 T9SS type A sorting domain-containing protein [Hymenobacter sp. ASUV-10]